MIASVSFVSTGTFTDVFPPTTGMRIFSSKRPSSIYSSGTFRLNIPHPIFNNRIHKASKIKLHCILYSLADHGFIPSLLLQNKHIA